MSDAGIQIILSAAGVPENLPHKTRKLEIEEIPDYITATAQVADGLFAVNFGSETPSVDKRIYPWVRLNSDGTGNGIWIWSGTEWVEALGSGGNVEAMATAYLTNVQAIATGTLTRIQFNAVDFNLGADPGPYDTTTYNFTVPHDGKYMVTVQAHVENLDNANTRSVYIMKATLPTVLTATYANEAAATAAGVLMAKNSDTTSGNNKTEGTTVSKILDCSALDTIAGYVQHDQGGGLNLDEDPDGQRNFMSIVRVN